MRQKEEADRQAQEAARRAVELERQKETARFQAIQAKLAMEATKQLLIAAGQDTSALEGGAQLTESARRALEKDARDKAAKAQEEETKRRAEQAKRLDYIVRALREAERVRAESFSAALVTDDEAYVVKVRDDATAKAAERHAQAMESRARLTRMLPHRAEFEAQVMARRHKAGEADRVRRGCWLVHECSVRFLLPAPLVKSVLLALCVVAAPVAAIRPYHLSGRSGLTLPCYQAAFVGLAAGRRRDARGAQ
jgi:hypothetical protein